ncbi:MAG: NUDIX domain-containing protein [Defluviitaleaceae bacterium]|nr:NUDIX domain-containing protein [Defluviitaleaceae bacterium]
MRTIKIFDHGDYDPTWPICKRDSARAIIFIGDQLLMVRSAKYGEYKFPGGGIEPDESHHATLQREVKEETGYTINIDTIAEYGRTLILRKSTTPHEIFEQESFYYICAIAPQAATAPTPDAGYEQEYGYAPALVTPAEAIATNEQRLHLPQIPWVQRDTTVLRAL